MTLVFIGIGAVAFVAIAFRFGARMAVKEPAASRVK